MNLRLDHCCGRWSWHVSALCQLHLPQEWSYLWISTVFTQLNLCICIYINMELISCRNVCKETQMVFDADFQLQWSVPMHVQEIYTISFHTVCRAMVWQLKCVNTRCTHLNTFEKLKVLLCVQSTDVFGRLNGEKMGRSDGTEQQNIQKKPRYSPEQQKNVSFCRKKCALMRGCTNERFC